MCGLGRCHCRFRWLVKGENRRAHNWQYEVKNFTICNIVNDSANAYHRNAVVVESECYLLGKANTWIEHFFCSRPFRSMWNIRVCVSCSSWGVEVYANEIITIHLALSNLGKRRSATCIQVLFYNLHGWRAHHKSCSEEERELQKRPNEWMNECGKCIVRILCVCVCLVAMDRQELNDMARNMCFHN